MKKLILPEGRYLETMENKRLCANLDGLKEAFSQGVIVEGMALRSENNVGITVELGAFTGFIPWYQGALGLSEGTVRDIAVLSRIGRPISMMITDIQEENGIVTPILSRSLAQRYAREHILSLNAGYILPATVTRLENFGAFVDLGCGMASLIGIDRISISRISHPSHRFTVGQEIYVALLEHDFQALRVRVTHRELLGTWEENSSNYTVGMTLPGIVRSIKNYGIFVELSPNFSGLAEFVEGLSEGQRVSVYIKAIIPQRMKCKLLIIGSLPSCTIPEPKYFLPPSGRLLRWNYATEEASKSGSETVFVEDATNP